MFFELFKWWYGSGWLEAWQGVPNSIQRASLQFSIPLLLRNLFAPWKRIVALPGRSLDEKFRSAIDNLVSRFIGFIVRLLTLMAAIVAIIAAALLSLVVAVAWPLIPLAIFFFAVKAIIG